MKRLDVGHTLYAYKKFDCLAVLFCREKKNAGHHKCMILLGCSHQTHPCKPPINQFCQAKRSSLHICCSEAAIFTALFQTVALWET